jgi:hypothetical protein
MKRAPRRAPTPDIVSIRPPVVTPTLVQYAPYIGESHSPVKDPVKRSRYKRERLQSVTSNTANKRQTTHQSPQRVPSSAAAYLAVDREESLLSKQPGKSLDDTTYLDFVLADCAGFYQISSRLYVV